MSEWRLQATAQWRRIHGKAFLAFRHIFLTCCRCWWETALTLSVAVTLVQIPPRALKGHVNCVGKYIRHKMMLIDSHRPLVYFGSGRNHSTRSRVQKLTSIRWRWWLDDACGAFLLISVFKRVDYVKFQPISMHLILCSICRISIRSSSRLYSKDWSSARRHRRCRGFKSISLGFVCQILRP